MAEREDMLAVLASVPERLSDLLGCLDEHRLLYRHGPAFPNLREIIAHLCASAAALDSVLRRVQLDGSTQVGVKAAIEPPLTADSSELCVELLHDYARIRRRTMDLLRGLSSADWERTVEDLQLGELSLRAICEMAMSHEIGHLSQARNLVALLPQAEDLGPVGSAGQTGSGPP